MEAAIIILVVVGVFVWGVWTFFSGAAQLVSELAKPKSPSAVKAELQPVDWDEAKWQTRDTDHDWQLPTSAQQIDYLERLHEQKGVEIDTDLESLTRLEASDMIDELKALPSKPHYTDFVETVRELKRKGELDEAEALLLQTIEATEAESRNKGWGVAPWYYEQLAIVYRKQKKFDKEQEILERFSQQKHAPGASPPKLLARLQKIQERGKQ